MPIEDYERLDPRRKYAHREARKLGVEHLKSPADHWRQATDGKVSQCVGAHLKIDTLLYRPRLAWGNIGVTKSHLLGDAASFLQKH